MRVSLESMTTNEIEMMRLIASGYSEKEIALQTQRSVKSVESRTYRLRKKLGVSDRVEVTKIAVEAGLVSVGVLGTDAPLPDVLSDRQREILSLVGDGMIMKDVASRCRLSEKAASSHKDRAMNRLGLRDKVAVYHYCQLHGLTPGSTRPAQPGQQPSVADAATPSSDRPSMTSEPGTE